MATQQVPVVESYRLRTDAAMTAGEDGALTLQQTRFRLRLADLGVGRRALLLRLADHWVDEVEVNRLVAGLEGENRILPAQLLLRRLIAHSWLRRRLQAADRPVIDVLPRGLGAGSLPLTRRHSPKVRYRMSRFATLSVEDDTMVAAHPTSTIAVGCLDPMVCALLAQAAERGCDHGDVAARLKASEATAGRILDELLTARVLLDPADAQAEHTSQPLAFWSRQELALHERSRPGRHVLPVGGTYRFRDRFDSGSLHRVFEGTPSVELTVPDLATVSKADGSLTEVVAARRSIRRHDDEHPVTVDQLAEFLYRVQRVVDVSETEDGQQVGHRPYPGGGGVHELEVYPVVSRCAGLRPGVYHYDSLGHRLERLGDLDRSARKLLAFSRAAAAMPAVPQVHLAITARMPRLMWKYEGMSYPLALKHTGVLTELMYLVATAMGLAACALGAGDSTAFADATGVDPAGEPEVADFVLGSRLEADA